MFLDDGLGTDRGYDKTLVSSTRIRTDLINFGWVPHVSKCAWNPMPIMEWLGFLYNLITGTISATQDKIARAKETVRQVARAKLVKARTAARAVGRVSCLHISHGDVVCIKTRFLQQSNKDAPYWNSRIMVSDLMIEECKFWEDNLEFLNVKSLTTSPGRKRDLLLRRLQCRRGFGDHHLPITAEVCGSQEL